MNEIPFDQMGFDESPPTIAYTLLALAAAAFDFEIVALDDFDGEIIVVRDEDSGFEYLRMRVSPMMGMLLVSILDRTGKELAAIAQGDEPWISNQS